MNRRASEDVLQPFERYAPHIRMRQYRRSNDTHNKAMTRTEAGKWQ